MKKVRITVSDFMFEILKGDSEYFKVPVGKIGNTLFKYYIDKNLSKIKLEESSGKKVQFNLSKENEDIFFDILREKKAETEAELMRDIFFTYINNLRFKREEIIFNDIFKQVREAIKNNKKIGIKYHSTARIVNPYFIELSSKENRSYLFCYCEKNQDFRNYRISDECSDKLAKVYFAQFYDEIEIIEPENLRENFKENFKRIYEMYIK